MKHSHERALWRNLAISLDMIAEQIDDVPMDEDDYRIPSKALTTCSKLVTARLHAIEIALLGKEVRA